MGAILQSLEHRRLFSGTLTTQLNAAFTVAESQISATLTAKPSKQYPSYTDAHGNWKYVAATDWTSGFLAGELWEQYARDRSAAVKNSAVKLTAELTPQETASADLAVRFLTTDGAQATLVPNNNALNVLIAAAASKIKSFSKTVGMFQSTGVPASTSGNKNANFPVLMDHTMDIELVYRAASAAGRSDWIKMANAHLQKLEQTMIRSDGGTYQIGYYNAKTGAFVDGETKQGLSNSSTWSRGQAWAIYSFTAAAELRGSADFLSTAQKLADYFIAHAPSDGVPYWDFNAKLTSTTPRDSSAAAIAADAFLRLAKISRGAAATKYQSAAENILSSLSSSAYLATTGGQSILNHGARWVAKGQTDGSLIFGDYYFLDAINRYEGIV